MYSVVLVMALAGGAEAPECHCGNLCGGWVASCGCHGASYGCYGGCYGSGGYGYGGVYGSPGYGYYGTPGTYYGTPGAKGEKIAEPIKGKDQANLPAPATIIVTLPADAKLTVDSYVSQQTSNQRRLVTPVLEPGQQFTYTLVAERTQNGQLITETQRVTVRAGQELPVNFSLSTMPAPANR